MEDLEAKIAPPKLWKRACDILEETSDESGEDHLGEGYLLIYEGWTAVCVDEIWSETEAEQVRMRIDIEGEGAEKEKETACYEYAEKESYKIIDEEWKPRLKDRGYRFICGGYDRGGLYGRTWALFRKDN
ncbi:MAG: hypothetical protein AMJ41_01080 [candidate division Zixibacteria bacterium DG_27]|nr:MAG: hypothetical protein AMJ41_01080 [candidate division Zixibacteria bacterium DG_27]